MWSDWLGAGIGGVLSIAAAPGALWLVITRFDQVKWFAAALVALALLTALTRQMVIGQSFGLLAGVGSVAFGLTGAVWFLLDSLG